MESCGGVKHLALLACLAIVMNIDMADVDCARCSLPHVSEVENFKSRSKHTCSSCGHVFETKSRVVCNPLLPLLQASCGYGGSFSNLAVFTISDVVQCASELGCVFDNDEVTLFLDSTLP